MTSSSIDMNAISDKELIEEFLERFAVPNFFSKQHVEEAHGDLTDDQWEKFKTDYNHSSSVHSEASKTFVDDVEYMFDANCDYESEDESVRVAFNCFKCSDPVIFDSEEHDNAGCDNDENWFCRECFSKYLKEQESEDEEQNCPSCKVGNGDCDCDKCGSYVCYEWDEDEEKLVEDSHCCGCGKYKDEQIEKNCPLCKVGNRDCDCDKCGLYGCYECVSGYNDGDYPNLCSKCENEGV